MIKDKKDFKGFCIELTSDTTIKEFNEIKDKFKRIGFYFAKHITNDIPFKDIKKYLKLYRKVHMGIADSDENLITFIFLGNEKIISIEEFLK